MTSKDIPIIVEAAYLSSKWCEDKLSTIRQEALRHDYRLDTIPPEELDRYLSGRKYSCVMVLGSDRTWIKTTVHALWAKGLGVLLICAEPMELYGNIFVIAPDRSEMMMESMGYMAAANRKRIALFGFNPSATSDTLRKDVFFTRAANYGIRAAEQDVYLNYGSIGECFDRFVPNAKEYDGVICANDVAAVYLIRNIEAYGIKVPQQMYVIGNGNTRMGSLISPSLTTTTINFDEVGRQAVHLYRYLSAQPSIYSIHATVACEIVARESTDCFQADKPAFAPFKSEYINRDPFFLDREIKEFFLLESLFCSCDEVDFQIMAGLLNKIKYEKLAEQLFISVDTLKYRIKKMFSAVGVDSRENFTTLLHQYNIKI